MFVNFTKELYSQLIDKEFTRIQGVSEDELTEETGFISLIRQTGAVVYIVNIINAESMNFQMYEKYIEYYKNQVIDMINRNNIPHTIMLDIVVLTEISEEFHQYFYSHKMFDEEKNSIYNIVSLADLKNKEFLIDKSQKILNIYEMVYKALGVEENAELQKINLKELEREIVKKTALKPKSKNTYITYFLMLFNAVIFIVMSILGKDVSLSERLIAFGANSRGYIIFEKQYWRLLSAVFLHVDLMHLFYNSFSLFLFGTRVEKYMGKWKFIAIYLVSGVFGNILSVLFNSGISAGASGAIYGLLGAVLALTQQTNRRVDNLSFYIVLALMVSGLMFGFVTPGIDMFAHIGGLLAGYGIGFMLCPEE